MAQASINLLGKHNNLLKLAKKAGCQAFFVGFESIKKENIKECGKSHNIVKKYWEVVRKLHDFGMGVIGSFIFGFDGDDEDIFPRTLEFIKKTGIDLASFTILTPLPGTPLFREMVREKRLLTKDWSKYDCAHVVFKPRKISLQKLQEGIYWMYKEFYQLKEVIKRTLHGIRYMKLLLPLNLAYHIVGKKGYSDYRPNV